MAIALVGSMGTVATGTTTASPTFAQSTTAGNLLVLWVMSDIGTMATPSGWSACTANFGGNELLYKADCSAGESAPSCAPSGAAFVAARLGEFSGAATTSPQDQNGNVSGTVSPIVANAAAADAGSGELYVTCDKATYSMAGTKTTTDTYNNGATPQSSASNDATSTASHYRFAYGITTGNASADQDSFAFTITNISAGGVVLQSFKVAAAVAAGINPKGNPRPRTIGPVLVPSRG